MKKYFFALLALCLFSLILWQIDFQRFFIRNTDCAFCDPKVLERQTFYTGKGAFGILTYKPAVSGHVLIIPERHVERFEDLTSEELEAIGDAIQKVDAVARKKFGHSDYLLIQKNGKGAGQSVPHVHFHYVPASRFLAAKFILAPWLKPLGEMELMCLKENLSESF